MYDNYNYPMGADTPSAPWNQSDPEPIEVEVCASITLSKSTTISVEDYTAEGWEDFDIGDEGETIHTGGVDYDFSNCDLLEAFKEQEYTIPELLDLLKDYAQADLTGYPLHHTEAKIKAILKACDSWEVDEEEVVES